MGPDEKVDVKRFIWPFATSQEHHHDSNGASVDHDLKCHSYIHSIHLAGQAANRMNDSPDVTRDPHYGGTPRVVNSRTKRLGPITVLFLLKIPPDASSPAPRMTTHMRTPRGARHTAHGLSPCSHTTPQGSRWRCQTPIRLEALASLGEATGRRRRSDERGGEKPMFFAGLSSVKEQGVLEG